MEWVRTLTAAGVLAGLGVGCSGKDVPSMPAGAPRPQDEKPMGQPRGMNGGPGPKQRPGPEIDH